MGVRQDLQGMRQENSRSPQGENRMGHGHRPYHPSRRVRGTLVRAETTQPETQVHRQLFVPHQRASRQIRRPAAQRHNRLGGAAHDSQHAQPRRHPMFIRPAARLLQHPEPDIQGGGGRPADTHQSGHQRSPTETQGHGIGRGTAHHQRACDHVGGQAQRPAGPQGVHRGADAGHARRVLRRPVCGHAPMVEAAHRHEAG